MSAGLQCCRLPLLCRPRLDPVQQPDQEPPGHLGRREAGRLGGRSPGPPPPPPPVGLSAPPTPSEAEPAPGPEEQEEEERSESSPGALRDRVPAAAVAAGAAHRQAG